MAINIKTVQRDKCSSCNASGMGSDLHEISISRSNTIQGSELYYRLCIKCVVKMRQRLVDIEEGAMSDKSKEEEQGVQK